MSKTDVMKWCPECGQMSSAKDFVTFRCKHCVEERGAPVNLPQHLMDYYGLTKKDIKKRKSKRISK
jgi:antitoxin component HigA of HigAB toxin-antitoxin module